MSKFTELKDFVASMEGDFEKFYDKGNAAAGTRVRKSMADLAAWAKATRVAVQEAKNAK